MKVRLEKTAAKTVDDQCSSTLDQTRSWSVEKDKNRITVKNTTAKTGQTTWKRLRYTFGQPNAALRTVLMNILDALYLTPPVVTSKPQFQNTFSAIATLFPICYLSLLKDLDMKAIVLGKHVRRTSFIKPKPSNLWEWAQKTYRSNILTHAHTKCPPVVVWKQ